MVIQIWTSVEDNFGYYFNIGYLRKAMESKEVREEAQPYKNKEEFKYDNKARVYDFTRTAQREIRMHVVKVVSDPGALPGLENEDKDEIQEIFDCLFSYQKYKNSLQQLGAKRQESMNMLIFIGGNGNPKQDKYVAHVSFVSKSQKTSDKQFKVDITLSCRRLTYFDAKDEDFDGFLSAMESLHVWNIQRRRVTAQDDGQIQN